METMMQDRTPDERRRAIIFLTILLCISLVLVCIVGQRFLRPLAYAVILATVFDPLQQSLQARLRSPRRAALIATCLVFLLIVIPLIVVLDIAATEAGAVAKGIMERTESEGGFVPFVARSLNEPLQFVGRYVDLSKFDLHAQLEAKVREIAPKLLPKGAMLVGDLLGFVVDAVLAIITCYFLLLHGSRIVNNALRLLPLSNDHANRLLQIFKNTIIANVQGVFAVAATQGIATGLILVILGVSPATLLGILAGICSIIPLVGSGLVWGPAAIYLIASGKIVKGLILIAIGAGGISMLDNIVRPLVVGNRMQANALVLMLAMLGGVETFGFLGLFIGPIVVALVVAIGEMLQEEIAEPAANNSEAKAAR
jgi:predicted PurR-regulated permease PerM